MSLITTTVSNGTNTLTPVLLIVIVEKTGQEVSGSLYLRSLPSPVFEISVVRAGVSLELNLFLAFFLSGRIRQTFVSFFLNKCEGT